MALPVSLLHDNNADVGSFISEQFLNNFSAQHFAHGNPFYRGKFRISDFEKPLDIEYVVQNPITFDLSPLSSSQFNRIWVAHLEARGANFQGRKQQFGEALQLFTPPNLVLKTSKLKFIFTVCKSDGSPDYEVDFEWDLEARCALLLVDEGASKAVRLEPIKVEFTKSFAELSADVVAKFSDVERRQSALGADHEGAFGGAGDPQWCTKVERLIIFILNQVLGLQLASFIRQWNLPRAIELLEAVTVLPNYVAVQEKYLIVGAQVSHIKATSNRTLDEARGIFAEFDRRFQAEISSITDEHFKAWNKDTSPSIKWLREKRRSIESSIEWAKESPDKAAKAGYTENFALASNDKLFAALAASYLHADEHREWDKSIDFLVRGAAGWWFKIFGANGGVAPHGFEVSASIDIGAFAEACIPNLDPKHWGEWLCKRICIVLRTKPADPFAIDATLNFWSKGIYGTFQLRTRQFEFDFCQNLPWPISELYNWFLSIFEDIFTEFVATVVALIQIKLVGYPTYFPGTPLAWSPRMNTPAGNAAEYLIISGDPQFK